MSQLDELKKYTTVVADTGDIESIKKFARRMPPPTLRWC
jgi:transaldolase